MQFPTVDTNDLASVVVQTTPIQEPEKPPHLSQEEFNKWKAWVRTQPTEHQRLLFRFLPWNYYFDNKERLGFKCKGITDHDGPLRPWGAYFYADGAKEGTPLAEDLVQVSKTVWDKIPEILLVRQTADSLQAAPAETRKMVQQVTHQPTPNDLLQPAPQQGSN